MDAVDALDHLELPPDLGHTADKWTAIRIGDPRTWEPYSPAPFVDWVSMVRFIKLLQDQNDDVFVLIDGREGSGKSTVGKYLARAIDATWRDETGMIIDYDDWLEVYSLRKKQVFVLDEGGDLLFSRDSMRNENKLSVRMFQMNRIFRHCVIALVPNKHWVDLYVRDHRALIYIQVHKTYSTRGVERGLATIKWPHRYYSIREDAWLTRWVDVFDLEFEAITGQDWEDYEETKMKKVEKRLLDIQIAARDPDRPRRRPYRLSP